MHDDDTLWKSDFESYRPKTDGGGSSTYWTGDDRVSLPYPNNLPEKARIALDGNPNMVFVGSILTAFNLMSIDGIEPEEAYRGALLRYIAFTDGSDEEIKKYRNWCREANFTFDADRLPQIDEDESS